jgi:hypothetical protein
MNDRAEISTLSFLFYFGGQVGENYFLGYFCLRVLPSADAGCVIKANEVLDEMSHT